MDAGIHYSRLWRQRGTKRVENAKGLGRVVILGTGWGAHSLVKVADEQNMQSLTVVSPRNFFFFTPLLSSTAVGTIEFRSIVEPIRASNPFVDYFEAYATDIDLERKVVLCRGGQREGYPASEENEQFELAYDTLVIAVGETTTTFGVQGARKYAYFLKEISDARRLRLKLLELLERASLPVWSDEERREMLSIVVVGGGPTGCEFAGELSDFVANDLAPRYGTELVSLIQVTLLQSGESLLTQFESSLQDIALENFRGRVEVQFGARVVEVTETEVVLKTGARLKYGILIWAAGNGTRPIVGKLVERVTGEAANAAIERRCKIAVDAWLRVRGAQNVFALGDCAVVDGEALPATAQVAGQQGAYLGRLISKADSAGLNDVHGPLLRDGNGRRMSAFRFLSLGAMAYLGNDRAIVQVDTGGERTLKVGGRIAFALWRSVYAVKQVDVRNRVLVLFDYFKSRVYGRDISQF